MVKVLLAGGGTAGHINPALAIAQIIKENRPDAQFLFAGTPFGMEAKLIPQAGFDFTPIKVRGFQRKLTLKNVARNMEAAAYLMTSSARAKKIINDFKPDIVIGTGGYVSGPIVMTAARKGIPTVIHEQNAYPGVTTRLLAKKVNEVMLTVIEAAKFLEDNRSYVVTGLPVRAGFRTVSKEQALNELGFDSGLCIFSWGGSLGAGRINETVADLIKWEYDNKLRINHIHSYGQMGRETFVKSLTERGIDIESNKRLHIREYIDNMPTCLAAADIAVCRCGAASLAELQALGKASVLIPSPIVAGNHQYYNAKVLEDAGAAILIEQKDLTSELLIETVKNLYNDRARLDKMSECAADMAISDTKEKIFKVIEKYIG